MPQEVKITDPKVMAVRRTIDPATIMAAFALLVSIAALGVAIYEAQVMRGQQRAMSWPYVQVSTSYSQEGFGIYVANKGAGPAKVIGASVTVDGEPVTNAIELIGNALGPDVPANWGNVRTSSFSNVVLEPSERSNVVAITWSSALRGAIARTDIERVEVEVCYCSIFDECWLSRLGEAATRRDCAVPEIPFSP